ncbi:histone-lysine N-methyltransferase ASHR1 isoform X2 [Vitis vinifera]|uniref:histone-lysine N-methyltransferase ASHR1 isoform X2 n=1 Tax=Vitis vinifera TaxID=29760 RepID=UPI0008FEB95D|nr:histone-lysine N-methyltransferase ASHR1 isoform X2 [Vitis vinifera]|eukprot:XP_019072106.1 PREDICTED: histone-lysine N-methyltransferase ASHR1 isoform X2 [Vitis vinifera]
MEDLQADLSANGLTVSTTPEKGEVIISQEPYVSVPNNSAVHSRCEGCFRSSNLKKCSACHVVWYCGSTCQKSDWKLHRLECNALSRLEKERQKSLTPSIRLMVKLYMRRKLQSEKIMPTTARDNYNLVEALVSHITDIDEKQLVLYAQMANLVNLILQWPDINVKEIAENFSKLACNAHTICDGELRPLGTGLYPVISIINHSCLPNSVLVFEERLAVVRAVQHIPKGTEVLISYIETAGSTITRQKALKEQYLFTCTCPRCRRMGQYDDIQESAILEGYRCKDDRCDGFLLRDSDDIGFICQQCGLVRNKEEIKRLASELKPLSDKATMSSSSHYVEATSIYKMIEKLQTKLFHPFSINLMRTREAILKILMEMKDWRAALTYCKLTIPVYQSMSSCNLNPQSEIILKYGVYPGFHPLLGLQYYTCGKLEWLLGETEDAVKSLTKAADILQITHGTNTPFMKELLFKLEEARAEASHKRSSKDK